MNLSPHFTLEELSHSATAVAKAIGNVPDAAARANLLTLAQSALEPLRTLWGCPIKVTSGFRSPAVNLLVGGAKHSAHLDGRAADVVPAGLDLGVAYEMAVASAVPYDQLIIERMANGAAWIHVAIARVGAVPRRQALTAVGTAGKIRYNRVAEG